MTGISSATETGTGTGSSPVRQVVVVGSGPAGWTAAVYASRASLSPLVIAGSVTAGGELMNTTEVENFPGFPDGVLGPDLMERLQKQAERFGTEVSYDDVTSADLAADPKVLTTGSGEVVRARTVVLATGSAYRKLRVPGEEKLSGHGVSWCATCDGFFFKGQDIAVIGGGDSALEEATFLSRFASSVTVVHRRGELRASKIMQRRAHDDPKVRFRWFSEVAEVLGDTSVTGLRLRDTRTGSESVLDVTGVFEAIGNDPRTDLVKGQLELTPEGTVAVRGRGSHTSLPGVFAAGDVVDATYRQAITAAGSGAAAALDAERHLAALGDAPAPAVAAAPAPAEPVTTTAH